MTNATNIFNEAKTWLTDNGYEVSEWNFDGLSIAKDGKSVTVDCFSSFYAVYEALMTFKQDSKHD